MPIISKILILSFLLLSSNLYSKEGDVYYCTTDSVTKVINGVATNYKDEKFKFLRKDGKIKFNSYDCFFDDGTINLKGEFNDEEVFLSENDRFVYVKGDFIYTHTYFFDDDADKWHTFIMKGTCDIF